MAQTPGNEKKGENNRGKMIINPENKGGVVECEQLTSKPQLQEARGDEGKQPKLGDNPMFRGTSHAEKKGR